MVEQLEEEDQPGGQPVGSAVEGGAGEAAEPVVQMEREQGQEHVWEPASSIPIWEQTELA